jgi:GT2 family glycosyltransferase
VFPGRQTLFAHKGDPYTAAPAVDVPQVRGKFLYAGEEKLWIRGVTYGTFRPDGTGAAFGSRARVDADFIAMSAHGFDTVRTYTVPPRWVLDAAARRGLRVMAGVPWEQHVTFLDDRRRARDIARRVREAVRDCRGHPALLALAVGNEIPAPVVRWHGRRRVERHLAELYDVAKSEDPDALVTYVNYPTTEYLELPWLDLVTFNVYLEDPERLAAYLARLQNLAGDRPLLMAEIGLDSRRHGRRRQAEVLDWQVRTAFRMGCAGVFVFAWTDEWHRGGHDIVDWDFGLTARDRRPKPALHAVQRALTALPMHRESWPHVTVVVCSYNGARVIEDCLEGLARLEYPSYDVVVIDDGSTDGTAAIARSYGVKVISTPNHGLSHARNLGLEAASGELIAYTDDDARPDPHWLTYLVDTFLRTDHSAVGGPNIPPPDDGAIAECVANAPGGPAHVLVSDGEAEHIPGCNMAFRTSALRDLGGFDPRFRTAGDDVDVCWRLRDAGHTIGFNAAAMVWHHRRNSLRAYWRQQVGYGRAEALLEAKWPEKYNAAGHVGWAGRIYGQGLTAAVTRPARIYHGTWGMAPFQSIYEPADGLRALPLMPEWCFLVVALLGVSILGLLWTPLLAALPLFALAAGATLTQALRSGARARLDASRHSRRRRLALRTVVSALHVVQPIARLTGRIRHGLTLWRLRGPRRVMFPRPRRVALWSEQWRSPEEWVAALETAVHETAAVSYRGGAFDRWDLHVRGGALGASRLLLAVEEHGSGKQFVRIRTWPHVPLAAWPMLAILTGLAGFAAADGVAGVAAIFAGGLALLVHRVVVDCGRASAAVALALDPMSETRN